MPSSPASTVRVSTGDLCVIEPQGINDERDGQMALNHADSGLHCP
jgi:hypothetical protein